MFYVCYLSKEWLCCTLSDMFHRVSSLLPKSSHPDIGKEKKNFKFTRQCVSHHWADNNKKSVDEIMKSKVKFVFNMLESLAASEKCRCLLIKFGSQSRLVSSGHKDQIRSDQVRYLSGTGFQSLPKFTEEYRSLPKFTKVY